MSDTKRIIGPEEQTPLEAAPSVPSGPGLVHELLEETGRGVKELGLPTVEEQMPKDAAETAVGQEEEASPQKAIPPDAPAGFSAERPTGNATERIRRARAMRRRSGKLDLLLIRDYWNWVGRKVVSYEGTPRRLWDRYHQGRENKIVAPFDTGTRSTLGFFGGKAAAALAVQSETATVALQTTGSIIGMALPALPVVPALTVAWRWPLAWAWHEKRVKTKFEESFDDSGIDLQAAEAKLLAEVPPLPLGLIAAELKRLTEEHRRKKMKDVRKRIADNGGKDSKEILRDSSGEKGKLIEAFFKALRADSVRMPYLYTEERYSRFIYARIVEYCRSAYKYQVDAVGEPAIQACLLAHAALTPEEQHRELKKLLESVPPKDRILGITLEDQKVLAEYATANSAGEGKKEEEQLADVSTAYGRMLAVKQMEKTEPQVIGAVAGTSLAAAATLSWPWAIAACGLGAGALGIRKMYRMGRAGLQHLEIDPKTGELQGLGGTPITAPNVEDSGSLYDTSSFPSRKKKLEELDEDEKKLHALMISLIPQEVLAKGHSTPQALAKAAAPHVLTGLLKKDKPAPKADEHDVEDKKKKMETAERRLEKMKEDWSKIEGEIRSLNTQKTRAVADKVPGEQDQKQINDLRQEVERLTQKLDDLLGKEPKMEAEVAAGTKTQRQLDLLKKRISDHETKIVDAKKNLEKQERDPKRRTLMDMTVRAQSQLQFVTQDLTDKGAEKTQLEGRITNQESEVLRLQQEYQLALKPKAPVDAATGRIEKFKVIDLVGIEKVENAFSVRVHQEWQRLKEERPGLTAGLQKLFTSETTGGPIKKAGVWAMVNLPLPTIYGGIAYYVANALSGFVSFSPWTAAGVMALAQFFKQRIAKK